MKCKRFLGAASAALMIVIAIFLLAPSTWAASKYRVLHKFTGGADGDDPLASVVFDQSGNLYGTTARGGISDWGTVFKLTPNSDGTWDETVLHAFTGGIDGTEPEGNLIFDDAGNLYGTAGNVVFRLSPNSDGTWSETVLYTFAGGADGSYAAGGLIFDQAGNLYGTTYEGGNLAACNFGCGTVYRLTPRMDGRWSKSVLHRFKGTDGALPHASLIFDAAGNLYGTTESGGYTVCSLGCGVVFQLIPKKDGSWSENVLHRFNNKDGALVGAGLISDGAGHLYGATAYGGNLNDCSGFGCGVVFQLTANADGSWKEKVLHRFSGKEDGNHPAASLTFDDSGNLYGTAWEGGDLNRCGSRGCGVVFKLEPNSNGGWHETVLQAFTGRPASSPQAGLVFDTLGNLYGTARYSRGSVFEITP